MHRELLAWILERYGFETISAKSGVAKLMKKHL
jgi:hypothetical protein